MDHVHCHAPALFFHGRETLRHTTLRMKNPGTQWKTGRSTICRVICEVVLDMYM